MKLLMIYATHFAYRTNTKTLQDTEDINISDSIENAIVALTQGEAEDVDRAKKVLDKLVKNLKWLSGKLNTKRIVLHSFAHLSDSKAPPDFVQNLFNDAQNKLERVGFEVHQTPFGYFLDLDIQAPGFSLARVFKDL